MAVTSHFDPIEYGHDMRSMAKGQHPASNVVAGGCRSLSIPSATTAGGSQTPLALILSYYAQPLRISCIMSRRVLGILIPPLEDPMARERGVFIPLCCVTGRLVGATMSNSARDLRGSGYDLPALLSSIPSFEGTRNSKSSGYEEGDNMQAEASRR